MSASNKKVTAINYLFVFLAINYDILARFVIRTDSSGYGLIMLSFIVIALNIRDFWKFQTRKPIFIWVIWCAFAFINYYLHPHFWNPLSLPQLYRSIFIPLVVLTVVVKEYVQDSNKLLWLCFIAHASYVVLGYYFDRGILFRIEGEGNVLGNAYAIISSFTVFYLALLNRNKKINTAVFLMLSIVLIVMLAMSGTRKAFGAGVIFMTFWALSFFDVLKIRTLFVVIALLLAGYWGYDKLIEKTYIGERIELLDEQAEYYLPIGAPHFLSIFGDRSPHYYYGIKSFYEHPIIGVGTKQAHVPQDNDHLYPHSEYIAQLDDGGLIGFVLFFCFYFWLVKHIITNQRHRTPIDKCMLGGIFGLLFLYLTAWGWEFPQYFICVGVLVGYCLDAKSVR